MADIYNCPVGFWQRQFLHELFRAVFALRSRVNFTNLARFSRFHEQTFRRHFKKAFHWVWFIPKVLGISACGGTRTLTLLYKNEGRLQRALQHAREALRLAPENPTYHYQVGQLLVQTGQNEKALSHLRATAEEWPWHYGAQYNLGQALRRTGRRDEAQQHLEDAEQLRSIQSQIQSIKSSLRSEPDNPLLHAKLGQVLRRAERYDDALHAYTAAVQQAPQNLDIKNDLANLHVMRERPAEAIPVYLDILQQDSTRVSAWMNLGLAYAMTGRAKEARRAWNKVLEQEPNHAKARSYLRRLKQGR